MATVVEQNFSYTGNVQSYTIPLKGIYKLEVWGASGGNHEYADDHSLGGKAGYSYGYKKLDKGTKLYIVVGQAGQTSSTNGAYNGGGGGGEADYWGDYRRSDGGGGGGATHIATRTGTLYQLRNYKSNVLIVAGGGGGASYMDNSSTGGSGGGITGGSSAGAAGGTQTTGYKFGQGEDGHSGHWETSGNHCSGTGGGGGGYYGGKSAEDADPYEGAGKPGGGGGSGYIGGVEAYHGDNPSTQNGVWPSGGWYWNPTNGKAKITLVKRSTVKLGNLDCTVFLGNKEISCFLGNKEL